MRAFQAVWSGAEVEAALARVRAYPFPEAPEGVGWSEGCDPSFLRRLCARWTDGFDWEAALARLNRWPQFTAEVEGVRLHFLHVTGEAEGRRPLLLVHGWPGSHYEFFQAIAPLAFPSRHGGRKEDAFDLVIPSLPGFGFSEKPKELLGPGRTAALFHRLVTEVLGYGTYRAQGGDWGSLVVSRLGFERPEGLKAIHLNMVPLRPAAPPSTPEEAAWAALGAARFRALGAYFQLQTSKPLSLIYAMAGNPVGQAAWILERFHDWADLRTRSFEEVFSLDDLITNLMLYVMTDAFPTSVRYYRAAAVERFALPAGMRVETPTAVANFPGEDLYAAPPRAYADKAYRIVRWTDMPRGGHFAAMEEPELFVEEIRAFGRATN